MLYVQSAATIAVGQWVRLWERDPGDGTLMTELHGGFSNFVPPPMKGMQCIKHNKLPHVFDITSVL